MKKYLPILKNSPFFTGLTDNEILSILHCVKATAVSKKRDSYIFRAGDSTEVMGLVVSGCVLVIQEDLWGHRNILAKCHTGDFFGEPYAASPGAVLNVSCPICRQSLSDIHRYPLIFLLTGSSWQIICALTVRQCLRRYQSYRKKAL